MWAQFVSTIVPPTGDELAKGTYRPSLAPVNFAQNKPGEKYATVWYAGPLSIANNRGLLQYIPNNLLRFTAARRPSRPGRVAGSGAARRETGRAIHRQRPVPAAHQEQGRPDGDLGARECERCRLHHRAAHGDGDGTSSQDRRRRPGRQSLCRRPPSTLRGRHARRHPAGQPLCDRGDDPAGWRAGARDAVHGRWRAHQECVGRPLHRQRHGGCAGRARNAERAAAACELRRRLLPLSDPGPGAGRGLAARRRDDARSSKARRSAPIRPSSTSRTPSPTSRASC